MLRILGGFLAGYAIVRLAFWIVLAFIVGTALFAMSSGHIVVFLLLGALAAFLITRRRRRRYVPDDEYPEQEW